MQERVFGRPFLDNHKKMTFFSYLCGVYAFNKTTAQKVCSLLGVSPSLKLLSFEGNELRLKNNLFFSLVFKLGFLIDKDLFKHKHAFLLRHVKIGSYKALRLSQGLPFRGQRTHTNAATAKRLHKSYVSQHLRGFVVKVKAQVDESRKKKTRR